ncbi:MAG: hypothetical protein A2X56_03185 [Nitrospirae bacterium GWC2_57_13]|nr:MAG: hypothetical protein A2X56_03185 [Nitrospirae bacterium GWC2_57_13]
MGDQSCIACGESLIRKQNFIVFDTRFGLASIYGIISCAYCTLEFTNPAPSEVELDHLYKTYYNYSGEKGTIYVHLRHKFLLSALYRLWMKIDGDCSFHGLRGKGRLIDIGCNEGRGLSIYRKNGFDAEGLEINQAAASIARAEGFTIYTDTIHKFYPDRPYDVVLLSNVLEHSLDQKIMLSHVKTILKSGGQLWISCPNNRSWLRSLFGRYWINWHVPFHIVHFSPDGLRQLLEEAGFVIVEMRHETPALWVAHSIIARLFARRGKPTAQLRNPFLVAGLMLFIRVFLFPILWLGNRLGRGDCLVVTAKKR